MCLSTWIHDHAGLNSNDMGALWPFDLKQYDWLEMYEMFTDFEQIYDSLVWS